MAERKSVRVGNRIGVLAPSAPVPEHEFAWGLERLRRQGFEVLVHPQCSAQEFLFAGSDEERFGAFLEFAVHPEVEVLWCARGGYGAARLLPLLARMRKPRVKKTLVGYSDATALLSFVSEKWGWRAIHAPMPGVLEFSALSSAKLTAIAETVRRERTSRVAHGLKHVGVPGEATGRLVGGNLSVLCSLIGTPYFPRLRDSILFLEEVSEPLYRIDRMVLQLRQAGVLKGVRGIVLGEFTDCEDRVLSVAASPQKSELAKRRPLRSQWPLAAGLREIFGSLSVEVGIPVLGGLKAGHGGGGFPLVLGVESQIHANGKFLSGV